MHTEVRNTFIFLFLIFLDTAMSANILSIQMVPFYSHQIIHYKLLKELNSRGHNLTVFSTHSMDFSGLNITQFEFPKPKKSELAKLKLFESKLHEKTKEEFYLINLFGEIFDSTKRQVEDSKIRELISNPADTKFDLLIIECGFCPLIVLAEIYDCPIVKIDAAEPSNKMHDYIGNYVNSAIHPEIYTVLILHEKMNFFQRFHSFVLENFSMNVFKILAIKKSEFLLDIIFPDMVFPTLSKILFNRLAIYISGVSIMTTHLRPTIPNYYQIGFSHLEPPQELKDLKIKKFLDESTEGVVVMSFGTIAEGFPDQLIVRFAEAFKELPFNFIWKANDEKYKHLDIPKNCLLLNWLPLADILAHPNVKLIISHGGLRTIEESIDREIPMILVPINFDQPFNALLQTKNKISKNLDLNTFSKKDMIEAVMEMTKPQYKDNIKYVKKLVYDRISTSIDEAVDNIEQLIKHNETFKFQMYDARLTEDYSEIMSDIYFMIGRFVTFIYTVLNYFFK